MNATISLPLTVFLLAGAAVVLVLLVALVSLVGRRHVGARAQLAADAAHEREITDSLTGLPNRTALVERYAALRHRYGWLAMLDLNGFKPVNDTYGHDAGDEVLVAVAQRLRTLDGVVAFRLQGDEFVLLLESPGIARYVREVVAAPVRLVAGGKVEVSAAVGVVDALADLSGTLHAADVAMYAQKPAGSRRGSEAVTR